MYRKIAGVEEVSGGAGEGGEVETRVFSDSDGVIS